MNPLIAKSANVSARVLANLPIEKLAEIPGRLPDELSIQQIALLAALESTEPDKEQRDIIAALIDFCKNAKLNYYGDINGWEWRVSQLGCTPNPYPKISGHMKMPYDNDIQSKLIGYFEGRYCAGPADCLIHRDDYTLFLQNEGLWPVTSLLANWWTEPEKQSPKNNKKRFDERVAALKEWLISKGYKPDIRLVILPKHYTLVTVYTELGKNYPELFTNIEINSFDSHFWGKQKLAELMRGNKSAIL
jgi:hypothetical protein